MRIKREATELLIVGVWLLCLGLVPSIAGANIPTPISTPSEPDESFVSPSHDTGNLERRIERIRTRIQQLEQSHRILRRRIEHLGNRVRALQRRVESTSERPRPNNGELKWKHRIAPKGSRHGALSVAPAIGPNGNVYVTGRLDTRALYSFEPDGSVKWTAGGFTGEVTVGSDGRLYVRSSETGNIVAVDEKDGTIRWETTSARGSRVSIAPSGGLYTQHSDGTVYKMSPEDGTLRWRFRSEIDGERFGDGISVGPGGVIYLTGHSLRGQGHRKMYAIRPDGRIKWTFRYRGESRSMPAVGPNGTVYAVINPGGGLHNSNGTLFAFDSRGNVKWKYRTGDVVSHMNDATFRSHSDPVVGPGGIIYIGSSNGHLYALHPDGSLKWKYDVGAPVKSTPAIGRNGSVYVGTQEGTLVALDSRGRKQWEYQAEGRIHGSVNIGSDGTLYFTSWDGYLHAVHSNAGGLAHRTWARYRGNARQSGHREN